MTVIRIAQDQDPDGFRSRRNAAIARYLRLNRPLSAEQERELAEVMAPEQPSPDGRSRVPVGDLVWGNLVLHPHG